MEIVKRVKYRKNETLNFIHSISYGGELYNTFNNGFIFRGHSSSIYKLLPSALRKEGMIGTNLIKSDDSVMTQVYICHLLKKRIFITF